MDQNPLRKRITDQFSYRGERAEIWRAFDLLRFDAFDADTADPTFRFRRTDTDETVQVTYHVSNVPDGGPAIEKLQQILGGTASDQQREAFADAWHRRVQVVLSDDSLFIVDAVLTRRFIPRTRIGVTGVFCQSR